MASAIKYRRMPVKYEVSELVDTFSSGCCEWIVSGWEVQRRDEPAFRFEGLYQEYAFQECVLKRKCGALRNRSEGARR